MPNGSLTVVGTGIRAIGQITLEAESCIRHAEKLLFLIADPLTARWLRDLNSTAESLFDSYREGKPRWNTYLEIVERILIPVRSGLKVCAAFYGHPGVFAFPAHRAIEQCRDEGYSALMLPGVSAEDCLYADLGIDPGCNGSQSYEATDFLLFERQIDVRSPLILWQIGLVGHFDHRSRYGAAGLALLVEFLQKIYGPSHVATLYEAALYPVCSPRLDKVALCDLVEAPTSVATTLFIPPLIEAKAQAECVARLKAAVANCP
jgi:hypothetical protein